jgi:Ca2+-binding RTX toxin-like protein
VLSDLSVWAHTFFAARRRRGSAPYTAMVSAEALESKVLLSAITGIYSVDVEAARDEIAAGVVTIHSAVQPGRMIAYGDRAFSVLDFPGAYDGPMVAGAWWGNGRVVAMSDHQGLEMQLYGDTGTTGRFYRNSIGWLANSKSLDARIVTLNSSDRTWLISQGYTNVVHADQSTLATSLTGAKVLIAGWLGDSENPDMLRTISDYVQGGGGLFVCEVGYGYDIWFSKPIHQAPANVLLRSAGIGFREQNRWEEDLITPVRATIDTNTSRMFDVFAAPDNYSAATQRQAAFIAEGLLAALPTSDPLYQQVVAMLQSRSAGLSATPATPVSNPLDKSVLTWEARQLLATPPENVTAHHTAAAVYGEIPSNAPRVTRTVTLNLKQTELRTEWHSTGLYAAPGELIRITVPAKAADKGLRVRLSGHEDDLSGLDEWHRIPFGISRTFTISSTTTLAAGAFGGAIYFEVPSNTAPLGFVDVTIQGAIEAPYFVLGQTADTTWINFIRHRPAPYAELSAGNVVLSVPSSLIRTLSNPTALMTYWKKVMDAQDDLGNNAVTRTRAERINIDAQVAYGYLHAGYPTQGPPMSAPELVDLEKLKAEGTWGWFHELGHEHQYDAWTIDGDTEVSVNLFTLYTYDRLGIPVDRSTVDFRIQEMDRLFERGGDFTTGDFFERLAFYQQIQGYFGWHVFRSFFRSYQDGTPQNLNGIYGLPTDDQAERDQWLLRMSRITQRDLTPHFTAWGYAVSQQAKDQVAAMSLPSWSMIETVAATEDVVQTKNRSVTFDVSGNFFGLPGNGALVYRNLDAPTGTLVNHGNGTFTFTPETGYSGSQVIRFEATNDQGGAATTSIHLGITGTTYSFEGGRLTVTGTSSDDVITVASADGRIRIMVNGRTITTAVASRVVRVISVAGLQGNDMLRLDGSLGTSVNGILKGNEGSDVLVGSVGRDTLDGGTGADEASYTEAASAVQISLASGGAQSTGGAGTDTLISIENLTGSRFDDNLTGSVGNNVLRGGLGNDTLTGGVGNDSLIGGLGDDMYVFGVASAAEADTVTEAANAGTDTLSFSTLTTAVTLNLGTTAIQTVHTKRTLKLNAASVVENAVGGSGHDTLTGNALANRLNGNIGNDKLQGAAGNDALLGGLGDDTYVFGLAAAAEADNVTEAANAGTDTLDFSTLTMAITLNLGTTAIQTVHTKRTLKLNATSAVENAVGGSGHDTLTGNTLANTLTGNAGNDGLQGAAGNDSLLGGLGNDTYVFGLAAASEADTVTEAANAGTDTLSFSTLTTAVTLNLGTTVIQTVHTNRTLKLNSNTVFENVIGGSGNDTLVGNSQANTITGNNGDDALSGGNGRDILIGGLGIDTLSGGNDDDILIAGRTTSDTLLTRLNDLRTEWVSVNSYGLRISRLRTGVGASVASLQAKTNVLNDTPSIDRLTGGGGIDWYFRALNDVMTDLLSSESIDLL